MAARQSGKETRAESVARLADTEPGNLVAPSHLSTQVVASIQVPGSSQLKVIFRDGTSRKMSAAAMRRLQGVDVAELAAEGW